MSEEKMITKQAADYLSIVHYHDCVKVIDQLKEITQASMHVKALQEFTQEEYQSLEALLIKYSKMIHTL